MKWGESTIVGCDKTIKLSLNFDKKHLGVEIKCKQNLDQYSVFRKYL